MHNAFKKWNYKINLVEKILAEYNIESYWEFLSKIIAAKYYWLI